MTKKNVLITVHKVEGTCPVFKQGDQFTVKEGYILDTDIPVCIHAMVSIIHFLPLLARGFTGSELGLCKNSDEAYVACPDPGPPYTYGGKVIFKIKAQ